MKKHMKLIVALAAVVALSVGLFAGCGGAASDSAGSAAGEAAAGGKTITVAMVNNPITVALSERIDKYEAEGVTVVADVLTEEDLRTKVTNMVSTGDATYDIYMVGGYETVQWKNNGWMLDIKPYMDKAPNADTYDIDDIFPGILGFCQGDNGELFALPFYGESSYVMYNKEMVEKAGITIGDTCTFEDLDEWAAKLTDKKNNVYGFVARGNVGWGSCGAPFTTIVNNFGATFYNDKYEAQFDTPEMRKCFEYYSHMLNDYGPNDFANCSYNDCIQYMTSGQGALYYDATSIGQPIEADGSAMQGNTGYSYIKNTDWIWEWTFAVNPKTSNPQECVDFMMWATSKDYVDMTMKEDPSGALTPNGTRASTFERDDYKDIPYAKPSLDALNAASYSPKNGSPYDQVQFAALPEWQDLGDYCTEQLNAYMTGQQDLDTSIKNCNDYFNQVAKDSGYQQ